jgi:hypothetical protein
VDYNSIQSDETGFPCAFWYISLKTPSILAVDSACCISYVQNKFNMYVCSDEGLMCPYRSKIIMKGLKVGCNKHDSPILKSKNSELLESEDQWSPRNREQKMIDWGLSEFNDDKTETNFETLDTDTQEIEKTEGSWKGPAFYGFIKDGKLHEGFITVNEKLPQFADSKDAEPKEKFKIIKHVWNCPGKEPCRIAQYKKALSDKKEELQEFENNEKKMISEVQDIKPLSCLILTMKNKEGKKNYDVMSEVCQPS